DTSDPSVLENFIRQFGDTALGELARTRAEQLRKQQVAIARPPTNPEPEPAPAELPKPVIIVPPPPPPTPCNNGIEITVAKNERRCLKPGAGKTEHFKDCPTCPEMVIVPSGRFVMGSPSNEPQRPKVQKYEGLGTSDPDVEAQVRVTIAAA